MLSRRLLASLLGFGTVAGVYGFTVCPTVPAGDSGELITVAHTLGVAHPPGYPLFTLIGAAADRLLPFGEPALRVNLVSALFGALSAALIAWSGSRLGAGLPASLFGAFLFAFSPVVWTYSSVAEVFTLNTFLNLAATAFALAILQAGEEEGLRKLPLRSGLVGLALGLGMSNHHTTVLVGAVIVPFLVGHAIRRGWPLRTVVVASVWGITGFVLGLTPYAYIPLAAAGDPPLNWDDPVTVERFLALVTRADYGSFQLVSTEIEGGDLAWYSHMVRFVLVLAGHTVGVGFLLAAVVLAIAPLRSPARGMAVHRTGVLLFGAAFFTTSFLFLSRVNSPLDRPLFLGVVERFYILPEAFCAVLAGAGLHAATGRLGERLSTALRWLGCSGIAALLLLVNHGEANQRHNFVARDYGANLLASLPEGALYFSRSDLSTNTVGYHLHVLGERPDVILLDQEKLTYSWYAADRRERHPELTIPGERYDGSGTRNLDLILGNEDRFPIFFFDFKETSYLERYEDEPHGLVRRIVRKGRSSSPERLYEINSRIFDDFETRSFSGDWPEKTFEREAMAKYSELLFNLGWEASQVGRLEESVAFYARAAELHPGDWRAPRNLGILYTDRLGRDLEGAELLERSLELYPEDPDRTDVEAKIRFHRARARSSPGAE